MQPRLLALLVPEGIIVLAAAVLLRFEALLAPAAPFLPAFPPLVLAVGAGLAARFGRSRVLLALIALAAADRALVAAPGPGVSGAVSVLLPLNLVALALLPERGVFTLAGLRRAGALLGQVVGVFLLSRPEERDVTALLEVSFLPGVLTGWTRLGDPAVLAFVAGAALLAGLLARRTDATHRGFLWALVAAFLALSAAPAAPAAAVAPSTFLLATAGVVLTTSVIEASHAMAYRDPLTGLPSRRALDEALRALDGGFAIAMVDVDHFKRFNDTYGHDVGDQVLRMVAAALGRVGAGGRPFRYGGEEFAVLFPERDAEGCRPALEAVRAAIEGTAFRLRAADRPRRRPRRPRRRPGGRQATVTVSIGLADRTRAGAPPDDVIRAADEALYRAKGGGRNRVVVAGGRT